MIENGKAATPIESRYKLLVDTHGVRFDGTIWDSFDAEVVPKLPVRANIAELGCGPGLFLFDVFQRLPLSQLWGLDHDEAMLDFARNLAWGSTKPRFIKADPELGLPSCPGSFDLVAMNFYLHRFDYPFAILAEVLRHLKDDGLIWLYDWARKPLKEYLQFCAVDPAFAEADEDERLPFKLFPLHNRFAREDWHFIVKAQGLVCLAEMTRENGQHLLMILSRAEKDVGAG